MFPTSQHALDSQVSLHIRRMPFLWIAVDDDPAPHSDRGLIERNSIALLSNYQKPKFDPPGCGTTAKTRTATLSTASTTSAPRAPSLP